jgi:hypothetical protein
VQLGDKIPRTIIFCMSLLSQGDCWSALLEKMDRWVQ